MNPDREAAFLAALGRRLQLLRVERYLSQQQLADAAGMSRSVRVRARARRRGRGRAPVAAAGDALGVPLARLLPEEEVRPTP